MSDPREEEAEKNATDADVEAHSIEEQEEGDAAVLDNNFGC
jgi:hypothetical protein